MSNRGDLWPVLGPSPPPTAMAEVEDFKTNDVCTGQYQAALSCLRQSLWFGRVLGCRCLKFAGAESRNGMPYTGEVSWPF